jgi:non-specific serine/threonine protein kinase
MPPEPEVVAPRPRGLTAFLGGEGRIFPAPAGEGDPALPEPAAQRRILRAFAKGTPTGLIQLASAEATTVLPAVFDFWRNFGRRFLASLVVAAEPLSSIERLDLAPPGESELDLLLESAPTMLGGEGLTPALLAGLWRGMLETARAEARADPDGHRGWLSKCDPAWASVGRICLHLAENRNDARAPFALLATAGRRSADGRSVVHVPLGQAVRDCGGDRAAVESLLGPLQLAAEGSPRIRDLVQSRAILQPLAWTPTQALQFLADLPVLEQAGLVVRIPEGWTGRRPPRPRVTVTVGRDSSSAIGAETMLDFSVELTLDGEPLTDAERRAVRESTEALVRLRGRWVEIDRAKLEALLSRLGDQQAANREGLPYGEAMRLLSGTSLDAEDAAGILEESRGEWAEVVAGPWLAGLLEQLRRPEGAASADDPGESLRTTLRPYQKVGVRWLRLITGLGLGACLADDMGLGKTIQVIGLLLLRRRAKARRPSLLVVPASLIANWSAEIERFAPELRVFTAHPSAVPADELRKMPSSAVSDDDVVITSYGFLLRVPWLEKRNWDLAVLDEAQAIKNPAARQTRAAKRLKARARIALTGTPVENRLGDLWSIFDFLCPGLLGSAERFGRFVRRLETPGGPGYGPLRELVRPYLLRRLKTDPNVAADLPDKTEVRAYCGLGRTQAAMYQETVDELAAALRGIHGIRRRGVVLSFLLRLKQVCNHPSQWLGDGVWSPEDSGKFARLREIAEDIAGQREKALVFTQFREMTGPLAGFLAGLFGRDGLVLHGGTPVRKRKGLVDAFQLPEGPPFLVVSLKAGGTGLNLTAASHVIHFDRWWNPAVEDQATDRAHRIGQHRNVLVHKFVCRGTVEERIDRLIESKRSLAGEILAGTGDAVLTEMSDEELLRTVALDLRASRTEPE